MNRFTNSPRTRTGLKVFCQKRRLLQKQGVLRQTTCQQKVFSSRISDIAGKNCLPEPVPLKVG